MVSAPTPNNSDKFSVELVPLLNDNYGYLLRDLEANVTGIVDPAESTPVLQVLQQRGLKLDYIINTHHHYDHTGGNIDLKEKTGAKVVGPQPESAKIPGIDVPLSDGQVWKFGSQDVHVLHTPGHTLGHICLYFPQPGAVFTGDTLFAMGCGRVFEGTHEMMHASLQKLKRIPPGTQVFCGHEYTATNVKFALSVDGGNAALVARSKDVSAIREQGLPTIPSTMQQELDTNPFLRATTVAEFSKVRDAKDRF